MVSFIDMEKLVKIERECYKVIACDELGYEYTTILGNGINSCEAGAFAWSILDMMGISDEEAEPHIEKEVRKLEEMYS